MSAQVFRTAIIHPAIEITKRRPHNERFVQYYGAEIGGDDAAIYEMSKQFEIKNSGEEDIYFKVKRGSGHNLLVAISPHSTQRVEITKHPINALNIDLERTIRATTETENSPLLDSLLLPTEKEEKMLKQETFHSTYYKKNYELR
jgi:vancomycin resistance protein YoaR